MNKHRSDRTRHILLTIMTFVLLAGVAVASGYFCTKYVIVPLKEGNLFAGVEAKEQVKTGETEGASSETGETAVQTGKTKAADSAGADDSATGDSGGESRNNAGSNAAPVAGNTAGAAGSKILYTIQYGSFALNQSAETCRTDLATAGIPTIIMEKSGEYKVVETPFADEAKARSILPQRKKTAGDQIFITTMEVSLQ